MNNPQQEPPGGCAPADRSEPTKAAAGADEVSAGENRFLRIFTGGPPNLEKIAGKSWWARHKVSLGLIVFAVITGVVPYVVTHLNGIPTAAELEAHQVTIVATQENDPHFSVDMADGARRHLEWPVPVSYHGGFRSYVWTDAQRKALVGCKAEIRGVPMRWTIRERYRIWALDCPQQQIHIGLNETAKDYKLWLSTRDSSMPYFFIPVFLFYFIAFIREGRGNLGRK